MAAVESIDERPSASFAVSYFVLCVAAVCCCQHFAVHPASTALLLFSAVWIAVLGVPHGGLDHWVGRRLLEPRLGRRWSPIFFSGYLLVALAVSVAWVLFPVVTILAFFVLSAWHFGREEQSRQPAWSAIASGGLVIWIAALARPLEMQQILQALIIAGGVGELESHAVAAKTIVSVTRGLAVVLVPLGLAAGFARDLRTASYDRVIRSLLVRSGTALVVCLAPILLSFTVYFCLWHSLLGLGRLRDTEGLTNASFIISAAPLSCAAVLMIVVVTWVLGGLSLDAIAESVGLRMLFIGLAAIAVPHILLHETPAELRRVLRPRTSPIQLETH